MGTSVRNSHATEYAASNLAAESFCPALTYGEFYGVFERLHEIPDFSLAVIAPDEIWMKGVKHSHRTSHFIFVIDGQYVLSSSGDERLVPPRSLIFVPAGTTHRNYPRTPGTRILTISVSDSQIDQARDYVRLPETESDFQHGEIGFLATRLEMECSRWHTASPLTAAGLCLELLAATAKRIATEERKPPRWLQTARGMLRERCCETLSIAEVAEVAGVHPIHLARTSESSFAAPRATICGNAVWKEPLRCCVWDTSPSQRLRLSAVSAIKASLPKHSEDGWASHLPSSGCGLRGRFIPDNSSLFRTRPSLSL